MANYSLPTNINSGGTTTGHKSHSDTVHTFLNKFDTTVGSGTPSSGQVLEWNGTGWAAGTDSTGAGAGEETEVFFSTLSGADDDAKLASFMTAEAANPYSTGRVLVLDEQRDYTFNDQQTLYTGFAIRGTLKSQDIRATGPPYAQQVKIRMGTGWFACPAGDTYAVSISNLAIDGDGARLINGKSDGILWTSSIRDIAIKDSAGVLGTTSQPLRVTGMEVSGFWYVQSQTARPFNIAGSDFYFNPSMMLLDTDPAILADSEYMFGMPSLSNTWANNIYITAEGQAALLVSGDNTNDNSKWIQDWVIEGRNNTDYSPGCLVRWTGSQGTITKTRFAHAMANPTLSGRSPTDAGVIHVTSGIVNVNDCTYDRQSTVAESVPFVYANGSSSTVRVERITPVGDSWTGKPVVQAASGATITIDDSVQAVGDSSSTIILSGVLGSALNTQTGTTYTLAAGDAGKCVEMNNASSMTLTLPVLYKGFVCKVRRYGAGTLATSASSTTILSAGGLTSVGPRYGEITVSYRTNSEIILSGDLV